MFVPDRKVTGALSNELSTYIESIDIFNSGFLKRFPQLPVVSTYTIKRHEKRIDLISNDMYQQDLSSLILIYNNVNILQLVRGKVLNMFSIENLTELIISLNVSR